MDVSNNLKVFSDTLEEHTEELVKSRFQLDLVTKKISSIIEHLKNFEHEFSKSVIYDEEFREYLNYAHFYYIIFSAISNDNFKLDYFSIERTFTKFYENKLADDDGSFINKLKESKLFNFLSTEVVKAREIKNEVSEFIKKDVNVLEENGLDASENANGELGKRNTCGAEDETTQKKKVEFELNDLIAKMSKLSLTICSSRNELYIYKNKYFPSQQNFEQDPNFIENNQTGSLDRTSSQNNIAANPNDIELQSTNNLSINNKAEFFQGKKGQKFVTKDPWSGFDSGSYSSKDLELVEEMENKTSKQDFIILDSDFVLKYATHNKIISAIHERIMLEIID